jgi:hypothetical protein
MIPEEMRGIGVEVPETSSEAEEDDGSEKEEGDSSEEVRTGASEDQWMVTPGCDE